MTSAKWVHLIGMCGVTMAPTAKMLQDKGLVVTGSDKGIFPPISEYIKERGLKLELGFKKDHLIKDYYVTKYGEEFLNVNFHPDYVVVGNFAGQNNVEFTYVKENKIPYYSYPEILNKYVIKENSIVVIGTYGKTTTTTMLAHILSNTELKPSYMFGGISSNFTDPINSNDSSWSVVEGDEYCSSRWDKRSKFFHYNPKYLLITSGDWDHTDIFKTEKDYITNFIKLVNSIPEDGLIIANINGKNVREIIKNAKCRIVTYSFNNKRNADFIGEYIHQRDKSKNLNTLLITNKSGEQITIKSNILGRFNYENMLAAYSMSNSLGISSEIIKQSLESFSGIKRRLEIIYENYNKEIILVDDFSSVPAKAQGTLESLRSDFPEMNIIAIFEPNTGNRTKESISQYINVFNTANAVIIPRLRDTKTEKNEIRLTGEGLANIISKTQKNVIYIEDDNMLIKKLLGYKSKTIIVFMGSGSFRGMIRKTALEIRSA